jgi:DNA-binding transcriptional MerR regulator
MDAPDTPLAARRPAKSEAAFRTISEVSEDLDVPQHVLRFWESKFAQIKPLKRGGGRRYYRPEDVVLLGHIRDLLYRDGYTIRGVQKLLREPGARGRIEAGEAETPQAQMLDAAAEIPDDSPSGHDDEVLRDLHKEILELRRLLADARRK